MDKEKLNSWEKLFLGSIVAFTALTLVGYLLLVLNLKFLIIPIFIFLIYWSCKKIKSLQFAILPPKQLFALLAVFILGIAGQMAVISPSGIYQKGDILFWSSHGHDGPWHIALMAEIQKGWPLQNPVFAGEKLVNYHFFSDLIPAFLHQYLRLGSLDLYFRIFPFLFSLSLGASAYFLGKRLGKSFASGLWAVIFTYFAGSFGFIVTYLQNKTIGGESIFWATQIQSASGNPPQLISNVILLTFLFFFLIYLTKKQKSTFLILAVLAGSAVLFKVYLAVVLLGSLALAGLWQAVKDRQVDILKLFTVSAALAALLYLPNTQTSSSFLIFQPWWFVRTMVVEPSRLNWLDLELRRQHYLSIGSWKAWARILELEGTAFLIFLFGNLGMRFIGFYDFFKIGLKSHKNYFNLLFASLTISSFILPLLFIQKGVASNTSQFLQYFILLFGILAGVSTAKFLTKIKPQTLKISLSLTIIALAIPTQVGLLYEFYKRPAFAKIEKQELTALSFLKKTAPPDAVILTPPYNQYLALEGNTPNIWDWADTAYVAAFSERRTYFDDQEQVDIMGYDFKARKLFKELIFNTEDETLVKEALKQEKIDYLYFPKILAPKVDLAQVGLTKIFANELVEVWQVPEEE